MCGIVGVAGDIGFRERKMFKRMLELDTIRGPHSTGIAAIELNNNLKMDKAVGTPWEFFEYSDVFKDNLNNGAYKVLIGHNRWATKGKVVNANAHPFDVDDVVGVHNGTIHHIKSLEWLENNSSEHEVDSAMLISSIGKNGLEKTISEITGAWSLVWWNKKDFTLNFLRNKDRPMHYVHSKDNKTLFWASEGWIIKVAAAYAGVELLGGTISTKENIHYELTLPSTSAITDKINFVYYKKPIAEKVFPAAVYVSYSSNSYGNYVSNYDKDKQDRYNKVKDSKGLIPIFFNKKTFRFESYTTWDSAYFQSLIGDQIVKVSGPPKSWPFDIKNIEEEFSKGFFKVKLGGMVSSFVNGETIVSLTADASSLEGPFSWDDCDYWGEETEDKEEDLVSTVMVEGHMLTIASYEDKLRKEGCQFCSTQIVPVNKASEIVWLDYNADLFLCPDCGQDHNIYNFAGV